MIYVLFNYNMKHNKSKPGSYLDLVTLKNASDEFVDMIKKTMKNIKLSQQNETNEIKLNLLRKIAEDYGISFNDLTSKYIKKVLNTDDILDSSGIIETYNDILEKPNINEMYNANTLIKTTIDNNIYYVENKQMGNVYDVELNIIGVYKDGNININIEKQEKYMKIRLLNKYDLIIQKYKSDLNVKIL